jgi:hypothetical protein
MNCIPETQFPIRGFASASAQASCGFRRVPLLVAVGLIGIFPGYGVPVSASATQTPAERNQYRVEFVVTPDRNAAGAEVELKLSQARRELRKLTMRIDPERIRDVKGDGGLRVNDNIVTWIPPDRGGSLKWFVTLRHQRNGETYDAYLDADWAVFRAEDIIPRATTRTVKGASSETLLSFQLPDGWSSTTPYFGRNHRYRVKNPERRFDLPGGWIALGKIGVRNETIAGIRVKVAGPLGHDIRRMDMLAFLHWTLPEFQRVLPSFPKRLTVISAAEPMWRGGLSGPQSLYIHASRPLISENATSTLLHEVFHVGFRPLGAEHADWIVEGLAEYYSLQVLTRSGSISDKRNRQALASVADWGKSVDSICTKRSYGPGTARSVTVFAELDNEIRKATRTRHSLDDVIRELASSDEKVTLAALRDIAARVMDKTSVALSSKNLPGCDD